MTSDQARRRRAHLLMLTQTLMVGPSYTYAQFAAKALAPLPLMGMRLTLSGLLLLPLFFYYGGLRSFRPTRRQWWQLSLLVLCGILGNQFFFLTGLRYTTPANSALLFALTPMAVLLIAVYYLRNEKLNGLKLLGVALALCGVVVIFMEKGLRLEGDTLLGNAITLIAVGMWACYVAFSRKILSGFNTNQATAVLMALGAIFFIPFNVYLLPQLDYAAVPMMAWFGLGYVVVVNSVLSYLMISYALSVIPSSEVAIYMNLQPVAATLFSVVFGYEVLTGGFALGALLTLTGIFVLNRAQRMPS